MKNYFLNYIEQLKTNKLINIYFDMDGVIVDYDLINHSLTKNNKDTFLNKRPIYTTIEILTNLKNKENIKIHILSVTRYKNQIDGKIKWLEKYLPFINTNNIHIFSREEYNFVHPKFIKSQYLNKRINNNEINIHIDDDHQVLKELINNKNIIPLHISSILD